MFIVIKKFQCNFLSSALRNRNLNHQIIIIVHLSSLNYNILFTMSPLFSEFFSESCFTDRYWDIYVMIQFIKDFSEITFTGRGWNLKNSLDTIHSWEIFIGIYIWNNCAFVINKDRLLLNCWLDITMETFCSRISLMTLKVVLLFFEISHKPWNMSKSLKCLSSLENPRQFLKNIGNLSKSQKMFCNPWIYSEISWQNVVFLTML